MKFHNNHSSLLVIAGFGGSFVSWAIWKTSRLDGTGEVQITVSSQKVVHKCFPTPLPFLRRKIFWPQIQTPFGDVSSLIGYEKKSNQFFKVEVETFTFENKFP